MTERDAKISNPSQFPIQELESAVNMATAFMSLITLAATFKEFDVLKTGEEILGAVEIQYATIRRLQAAFEGVRQEHYAAEDRLKQANAHARPA